jgi:hypothetical protein
MALSREQLHAMTDDELEQLAVANPVGNQWSDSARVLLEIRNGRRIAESITRLEWFAARTEKSGKIMAWATGLILLATLVQVVLAGWSAVHGH